MTRREFLKYAGEAGLMVAVSGACLKLPHSGQYVRPPGAIPEDAFFTKCIKCGICVEVCPSHALDFVGLTTDIKNIGTPRLNPRHGGCIAWKEPCSKCMDACPTDALKKPLDIHHVKIGNALVRKEECVNCLMCFQVCPIEGAVRFPNPNGRPYTKTKDIPSKLSDIKSPLKPYIDNTLCTGCGLCAHICPPHCIDITPQQEKRAKE